MCFSEDTNNTGRPQRRGRVGGGRFGETGTEEDSHKKRVGVWERERERERETGKAEMRKRTQSEFQFTPGRAQSNGGREKREGGGKSVQEGRETCYFFLDLLRHTYTQRNTPHGGDEVWSGMEEGLTDAKDQRRVGRRLIAIRDQLAPVAAPGPRVQFVHEKRKI